MAATVTWTVLLVILASASPSLSLPTEPPSWWLQHLKPLLKSVNENCTNAQENSQKQDLLDEALRCVNALKDWRLPRLFASLEKTRKFMAEYCTSVEHMTSCLSKVEMAVSMCVTSDDLDPSISIRDEFNKVAGIIHFLCKNNGSKLHEFLSLGGPECLHKANAQLHYCLVLTVNSKQPKEYCNKLSALKDCVSRVVSRECNSNDTAQFVDDFISAGVSRTSCSATTEGKEPGESFREGRAEESEQFFTEFTTLPPITSLPPISTLPPITKLLPKSTLPRRTKLLPRTTQRSSNLVVDVRASGVIGSRAEPEEELNVGQERRPSTTVEESSYTSQPTNESEFGLRSWWSFKSADKKDVEADSSAEATDDSLDRTVATVDIAIHTTPQSDVDVAGDDDDVLSTVNITTLSTPVFTSPRNILDLVAEIEEEERANVGGSDVQSIDKDTTLKESDGEEDSSSASNMKSTFYRSLLLFIITLIL